MFVTEKERKYQEYDAKMRNNTIAQEELQEYLEMLEKDEFYIRMIDHWSQADREEYARISIRMCRVKRMLKKIE